MQTFSSHKKSLGQWMGRLKVFFTSERSIDWTGFGQKVSLAFASKKTTDDFNRTRRWSVLFNQIKPRWCANFIRNVLIVGIVFAVISIYLAIERLPRFSEIDHSVPIYQVQDLQNAAKLFGRKDVDLSKVQLTGLMRSDGSSTGYAIFEVDGKNSGAIAVGETFDKGYFLKSIGVDSVEIVFQGKQHQILMMTKRF
jgi:hypothetical protein